MRVDWTHREGLVLNTVSYTDGDDVRPVLYRASLAEMTVPYGDPSVTQARKNAFDVGEYGLGMLANSLVLGCDCLGEIHYLDGHFVEGTGEVITIPQAICIHEEDAGIAWKHTDFRSDEVEVRRMRRLVVSFIATVGNYEYGLYWYFYQDGRIELDIKLTGMLSTAAFDPAARNGHVAGDGSGPLALKYGADLGDGLYGPNHQHFFCIRMDTQIDGVDNSVVEVDTTAAPPEENPFGNAFHGVPSVLSTEQEAQRLIDPLAGRYWKIVSSDRTNRVGGKTGYKLIPGGERAAVCHGGLLDSAAGGLHVETPVGHPVRPRRELSGRQVPEPASRRRRASGLDRSQPERGRHRRGGVVRDGSPPFTEPRGLAGDAGGPHRLHAQAVRLLR